MIDTSQRAYLPQSLRRDRVVSVSLAVVAQSFQALSNGGIAMFLPLIRQDLQMTFTQAGMLSAASTLTYALGQVPAGYLSDRFGPKRLFFIGLLGSLLLSMNFGLIGSFELALANQAASGVFRSLLFAPGLSLVSAWFPPERRAMATGIYISGGFTGNVFLSLGGPLLVASFSWRYLFVGFALLGIAVAFAFLAFGKEKPADLPRRAVGLLDASRLFKYPLMWVCAALQFVRLGVALGYNYWLPSLLVADRGFTIQEAGFVVALGAAATALSNILGGYVSDRLKNPPLVIGGSLAILACTSALQVVTRPIPLLLLVIFVNYVFLQFYFGPLFQVPVEVFGSRVAGTSHGFSNLFANLGSLVFTYSLGVVKDTSGTFAVGFLGVSAACVLGVLLSLLLARMRRQALASRLGTAEL